jgi:hypothetical protein
MARKNHEGWKFGRRPKHDDFDDLDSFENEDDVDEDDDDDENEEVDFDNPKFKKSDMWNDYAEDLDFEE